MAYKEYTKAEKMEYAKQFTPRELAAYRAGVRRGFLQGCHKPPLNQKKKSEFMQHTFTQKELDSLFDDIDKVKLY